MMQYRCAKLQDFDSIVEIHLQSFNNFFLTSLGKYFLNTYYKACLKSTGVIAVVSYNVSEHITGFAIGCLNSKGFHKRLLIRNFFSFGMEALRLVFTKPASIVRLIKNLSKTSDFEDPGNYTELLSIAVTLDVKGMGIGNELIRHFEEKVRLKGSDRVSLTTDYYDNNAVLAFYKKSGYKIMYDFITYPNRRMYRLIKHL